MSDFLSRILASYNAAHLWMSDLQLIQKLAEGRASKRFDSLEDLSLAVSTGQVEFGDFVRGHGWLSLYASWYLPGAYSPYHLSITPVLAGERWAVRTTPLPALLPAGQLPFGSKERIVGFLYPTDTWGFAAELIPDDGESRYGSPVKRASVEDNSWIFSLDSGNSLRHPMDWIFLREIPSSHNYLPRPKEIMCANPLKMCPYLKIRPWCGALHEYRREVNPFPSSFRLTIASSFIPQWTFGLK